MVSLRSLTITFLIAFAAATTLTGLSTFLASRQAINTLVDERIDTAADALLSNVRPGDRQTILARMAAFAKRRETGDIGFELEDASGRHLGGNVDLRRHAALGYASVRREDNIPGITAGRVEVRDAGHGLRLVTIVETEPIDGYASRRARNYALGFGSILFVVLAGTIAFATIVRRHLAQLGATADALIDGDLNSRVPVHPGDGVFARQAITFNRMLDRIAALVAGTRQMSDDIAHDMRTPLARLRSRISRLQADAPDDARSAELATMLDQCDDILAMFASVLRISELTANTQHSCFTPVDLSALAIDSRDDLEAVAAESGFVLDTEIAGPVVIDGDRQLLRRAAYNLVENAIQHGAADAPIMITTSVENGSAILRVIDRGPGIAPDDHAIARRRFGRLEASRTTPGHGLGLPLIDAIAALHGGELVLGDAHPGLVATLVLPIRERASGTTPLARSQTSSK